MKYLFINSVVGIGSTGRIVVDQCRKLKAEGHQCVVAFGRNKGNCDDIETLRIGTSWDYRFHGLMTRVLDLHGFGSKKATRKLICQMKAYDPDVIWLHNIHGYYINLELLFEYLKTCGKEIHWTLHDCWAFTGHCSHFTAIKCEQWKCYCSRCQQTRRYPASLLKSNCANNFVRKKAAFTGVNNMTLITPSRWLAELVRQSFLKEYPVEVVYNTIDKNVFKPTPGDFRERYGLQDKKIVLGVANVWDHRKGLDDFIKLAGMLDDCYQIVLVGLSEQQIARLPGNVIGITRTNSTAELAEIYTAADVFVNPTYEDNYPTVNLEAQACGTPVVTYDTGGCRETLMPGKGCVVEVGNINQILEAI